MSYPERGAGYRRHPKFLDDAIKAEGHAQGGPVSIGKRSVGNGAGVGDIARAETDDAKGDLDYAMRRGNPSNEGESGARAAARNRLSSDPFEAMSAGAYSHKHGGHVRKRAEGGMTDDEIAAGQMMAPTREMRSQQENKAQDMDELVRRNLEQMAGPSENQSRKFVNPYGQRGRLPNALLGMKRGGRA